MRNLIFAVVVSCSATLANAQQVVYVQEGRLVPVNVQRVQYQAPIQQEVVTRQVSQQTSWPVRNAVQTYEMPSPQPQVQQHREEVQREEYIGLGQDERQQVGFSTQRRRDFDQDRCHNRKDCDRDWCPPSDRCFDKCCKDLFLQCRWGSFVLKCDGTGVATYQYNSCVRGTSLKEIGKDNVFVYYQEDDSDTRWAFSRACCPTNGHSVFKSKQRGNPLDCDWEHFCYAPPSRCAQPICDKPICRSRVVYDSYDPYLGR